MRAADAIPFILPIFAGLFCFGASAYAQQSPSRPQYHLSGHDLSAFCASKYDVDAGFCAGYVTAVAELMLDHALYGLRACNHGPVRSQQLMDIIKMSQRRNPAWQDAAASTSTAAALADAFPCR